MTSDRWPAGHPQNSEMQERARRTLTLNATNARSVAETLALLEAPTVLLAMERDTLVARMTRFADDALLTAFLARPHALPEYATIVATKGSAALQARLVAWLDDTLPQAADEQDLAFRVARALIANNALPIASAAAQWLVAQLTPVAPTADEPRVGPDPAARASQLLLGLTPLPEAVLLRIVALPEHDPMTWHRLARHASATSAVSCAILAHPACNVPAVLGAFCTPDRVADPAVRAALWPVLLAPKPLALMLHVHTLTTMATQATGTELARILGTLAGWRPSAAVEVLELATPAQWASLTRRDLQPIFVHGTPAVAERGMALLDRFPRREVASTAAERPRPRGRR